jgi:hypothetical protein
MKENPTNITTRQKPNICILEKASTHLINYKNKQIAQKVGLGQDRGLRDALSS